MGEPCSEPDLAHPAIHRVAEVAARKGVALDIRQLPSWARTAEDAAAALRVDLGQIVKAEVLIAPRSASRPIPIVCLVCGRNRLDLRLLAGITGEVALREATAAEALELTGYPIGGMPPFGHRRDVRILMDQDLGQHQSVWAAAGAEASIFKIAPGTLRMLSNAIVIPIGDASWGRSIGHEPSLSLQVGAGGMD
jgi:prolyl-tRNA editing enzyme YbaK/EbsC (Cys-tRNA(Pro) deacylase)